jgi:hypothetical protein
LLLFGAESLVFQFATKNIKIKIYRTFLTLHLVLYACDTWSLILREEHRLRVFKNREKVTGEWRQPQNEELF